MTGGRARDTATAIAYGGKPAPRKMRLISFKPMRKGALRGFATVQLPIGLTIEDCPVLAGPNGHWSTLPSRPVLDGQGRQAKPSGKPQYASILKWRDRELSDRFSQAVIALVRQKHPQALDDAGELL
jgi:hypothetical protein